jgi:hypothetical protein
MVSAGVINSVFFGVYSQVLKVLGNSIDKEHDHPDYLKVGIASSVAGMAQLIIACPTIGHDNPRKNPLDYNI